MRSWALLRGVAYLGKIAKELKRIADMYEADHPVVPMRVLRKTEISHPTVAEWNKRYEEGRERIGL